MNCKLLALDVDGTLLNDRHQILEKTRVAIRQLAAAGVMVVLCTGRGPFNTLPVMSDLGIDGYLLSHNGGVTCHSAPYRVLEQATFPMSAIANVIAYCRSHGIHFDVCSTNELFVESVSPAQRRMYEHFLITPVHLENMFDLQEPIVKLTLFGEEAQMDQVEAECRLLAPDLQMIRSDVRFIDFMLPGVSKGTALHALCRRYRIAQEHVMAIGNYYNDVDMIRFAGVGVAMGNSPADVQALADYVTATNNEEGVWQALQAYRLLE